MDVEGRIIRGVFRACEIISNRLVLLVVILLDTRVMSLAVPTRGIILSPSIAEMAVTVAAAIIVAVIGVRVGGVTTAADAVTVG